MPDATRVNPRASRPDANAWVTRRFNRLSLDGVSSHLGDGSRPAQRTRPHDWSRGRAAQLAARFGRARTPMSYLTVAVGPIGVWLLVEESADLACRP